MGAPDNSAAGDKMGGRIFEMKIFTSSGVKKFLTTQPNKSEYNKLSRLFRTS
jgi:hypothetical protein